jgi:hypothetical protein
MLARVYSCAVIGVEGVIVEVEVDYSNGLPAVIIVGLPDAAVQESRERVQTAVKNAGLDFPRHRIVVNLAPAAVRKEGPAYDLPIALGVMILAGFLPQEAIESTLVIGELSLDGGPPHPRCPPDGCNRPGKRIQADVRPGGGRGRSRPDPGPGSDSRQIAYGSVPAHLWSPIYRALPSG